MSRSDQTGAGQAGIAPTGAGRASAARRRRMVPLAHGLSARLLVLTACFVLIVEVLIFLPTIANYRLRWLDDRLGTAAAISILLVDQDSNSLSRQVQNDLLLALGARAIAVRDGDASRLLVVSEVPPAVDEHVSPATTDLVSSITGAVDTMIFGGDRMLRVYGKVGESKKEFELIIPDIRLKAAMWDYAGSVALVSLILSLTTATLVFYTIDRGMIRPIRRMTNSMLDFAASPDDPGVIIVPERRRDEIGVAERELSRMQGQLQRTLVEQKHLADLGLAVSKINHDMRNILASVQMMSDRLATVKDPSVQALAPKLVRALDRAVSYSEGVLAYGRTQEAPPARRRLRLRQLVDDLQGMLGLDPKGRIEFVNAVGSALEIDADPEQLFRVLTNLCRNAVQAMHADTRSAAVNRLTVSAQREGSVTRIFVSDTGPGLPQKARDNLFAAFRGSARSGGTGLGLAIAQELVRAHSGTIELVESVGGNTTFAVTIPDQPVRLDVARDALRRPA